MFEQMSATWVFDHAFTFLKALLFVMMDLTGGVSSGALDMAKSNLDQLLIHIAKEPVVVSPSTPETPSEASAADEMERLLASQRKSLHEVTHELVRQITSPNETIREQAMHSLKVRDWSDDVGQLLLLLLLVFVVCWWGRRKGHVLFTYFCTEGTARDICRCQPWMTKVSQ